MDSMKFISISDLFCYKLPHNSDIKLYLEDEKNIEPKGVYANQKEFMLRNIPVPSKFQKGRSTFLSHKSKLIELEITHKCKGYINKRDLHYWGLISTF